MKKDEAIKERINIQVAFVHGPEYRGRASQLTVPNVDMSIRDIRKYLLGCLQNIAGTENDREIINHLMEECRVTKKDIERDPIQIRHSVMGIFMETELPSLPILEKTHVLFIHPTPLT